MRAGPWLVAALAAAAALPVKARAATFTVTTAADSGAGSLREAIALAEANGEADTIGFAADYTIVLASTLPTVTTEITICGNGWDWTIVDGNNPPGGTTGVRAFEVASSGSLTLDGVMVRNCLGPFYDYGGAVVSQGALRVVNSVFRGNAARWGYGGAIVARGARSSLGLLSTRFELNSAESGGAVEAQCPTTIDRCSFVGNSATDSECAALCFAANQQLQLRSSTFSGNLGYSAISVFSSPAAQIEGVTITGSSGIALRIFDATVSLSHSILTGSGSGSGSETANCAVLEGGSIVTAGHNIEDGNSCGLDAAGTDLVNTDPMLGPLVDSGRLPPFHPLLAARSSRLGLRSSRR